MAAFSFKVKTDVRQVEALQGFQDSLPRGEAPPDFALPELDGGEVALAKEVSDHVVIVVNYWATWFTPCRMELLQLQRLYEEYQDEGVQILAVNVGDTEDTIRDFLNERPVSFPVLLDPDGVVAARHRVHVVPTTILLNADGVVTAVLEGIDPYLAYRVESLLDEEFETGMVEY